MVIRGTWRHLGLLLIGMMICGCSQMTPPATGSAVNRQGPPDYVTNPAVVRGLQHQYARWNGVPYQYGGLSRAGVDCSGLVFLTFVQQFGVTLPRTTREQALIGKPVRRSHLQPGDLVFFKTRHRERHVGIYWGHQQFMHVSSKKGVTLSSLSNVYWRHHYWQARRLVWTF